MALLGGYGGNPNLSGTYETHNYTKEQLAEIVKCLDPDTGPVYFIKNYMKIVHVDLGIIPFKLWDFQEEMVNTIHKNRFTICKIARQSGKSTTSIGYLLWYIMFHSNKDVAVLANKGATSRELLSRLQLAYEHIPRWMQQGITIWNKGYIQLANGSSILAESTSSSSVRGRTFAIIFLDEFAFVNNNLADDFFQSTFPVISSGKNTKCIIVSTPNGMNKFYKMWTEAINGSNEYKHIDVDWTKVPGRDEAWKKKQIALTDEAQFSQEFECSFLGSAGTLISGAKLKQLVWLDPVEIEKLHDIDSLALYDLPQKNHTYVMTVDVSHGQGLDNQAFSIIDVTELPYKQVGRFMNNLVSPLIYPTIIHNVAKRFNDAFVLVEINDIGQQIVDILHYDFSYENLIKLTIKGKQGQGVSGGYKKQTQFGIRTTSAVKRIGCSNLKALVEGDKLIINDFATIEELTTFIAHKESFAAEEGAKDDLAMSLVLFGWLANQRLFKETIGNDIRRALVHDQLDLEEEIPSAFGFIDKGNEDNRFQDADGTVWIEDPNRLYPLDTINSGWNPDF